MAAVHNSHFLTLPIDNQAQVFNFVWGDKQNLENRLICKSSLKAINILIKKRWEDLQKKPPIGPFGFENACSRIKKKFSVGGCFPENFNYLTLFRSLNQEWTRIGMEIQEGPLNLTSVYQSQLQTDLYNNLLDFSLTQMWCRFIPHFFQFCWVIPDAETIRNDMGENHAVLESTVTADFSGLEIRFIPVELNYFCNVTQLKLSQNHIEFLPDFIGKFKQLQILNLEDNELQELPKDFPNWTHLKMVDLTDNPLNDHGQKQLAEWKKNVASLRTEQPMELG